MMNPEFVFVSEETTRDEVLNWMRGQDLNLDQLDTIVLLDNSAQFSGTVPVARLLLAAGDQRMMELKMEPLLSLPPNADDKEVFELFDKYNLRMLTVINKDSQPIGAITVDDVVSRLVKG
jgi:magnesium transporter